MTDDTGGRLTHHAWNRCTGHTRHRCASHAWHWRAGDTGGRWCPSHAMRHHTGRRMPCHTSGRLTRHASRRMAADTGRRHASRRNTGRRYTSCGHTGRRNTGIRYASRGNARAHGIGHLVISDKIIRADIGILQLVLEVRDTHFKAFWLTLFGHKLFPDKLPVPDRCTDQFGRQTFQIEGLHYGDPTVINVLLLGLYCGKL